ncbi:MAG: phosphoribosylaminoimidazolesuccinocarboxamide synthase [Leptospirales bacterium]|nr:phosphoribosylaminoimidazolesuccinocarboxamide synthase [Leptospirales bacterium]HMZ37317.1 phosphoribosylaminoimidazolesuccinocarboxamide synthase [Leptospiraceae bacterium]
MKPFYRGKVRDLYEAGPDSMVLVATDRLSAFDVVFPDPVPGKGRVLTRVSSNWFAAIRSSGLEQKLDFTDHIIETNVDQFPEDLRLEEWKDRAVLAKKTKRIDFECVVRGYLAGSAFKEYRETGTVCGESLPPGLLQADKLPSPIFTPATKAETGHDENISFSAMKSSIGELADRLRDISTGIFEFASERMARAGILLCDTKFEFGLLGDRIVLIDEVLTPDSSRYWDVESYKPGSSPAGFDKQFVRDYVESIGWNKQPPAPSLPGEVIQKTTELYLEIERRIASVLK